MDVLLRLDCVRKRYGNGENAVRALDGVSMAVEEGGFLAVMGASGSGKTTLLNCVSTMDKPDGGSIFLAGTDVTGLAESETARFRRENLGFIFQEYNLLDTLTVKENIMLPLTLNKARAGEIDSRTGAVAEQLRITDILDRFPCQISGGQKQKCACARAIVNRPRIILADEPTGALDSHSARALLSALRDLNERQGAAVLMVTHDALAASYSKRVIFFHDGKIAGGLARAGGPRKDFFEGILNALSQMGGGGGCMLNGCCGTPGARQGTI